MSRFPLLLAATVGVALSVPLAAPAAAQKTPARKVTPGAKTAAKVSPQVRAEFARSDTNKDGFLSRTEVTERVRRMDVGRSKLNGQQITDLSTLWFARADTNKDGKISPAEMQALLNATARRYDTNGDGVVSVEERQAARAETLNEVRRGPAGPKNPGR
ncbi:EF hand [Sphingomonas gellani]|uniref:EF hand n=2 Tax=Sphingomonas gellani TaxID=1166340 RepID=A0A1H8C2V7_9SPHN|nr:EF hand [Sphingomonas gellani]